MNTKFSKKYLKETFLGIRLPQKERCLNCKKFLHYLLSSLKYNNKSYIRGRERPKVKLELRFSLMPLSLNRTIF